jgi:hypothetical protein
LLSQNLSPNPNPNVFPANKNRSFHLENTSKLIHFFTARQQKPNQICTFKKGYPCKTLKIQIPTSGFINKAGGKNPLEEISYTEGEITYIDDMNREI